MGVRAVPQARGFLTMMVCYIGLEHGLVNSYEICHAEMEDYVWHAIKS